jgi:hypothetical protein
VTKEPEMAKFKDEDEIEDETLSPRSPADQRRHNSEQLDEYVDTHEKAAKDAREK